MCCRRGPTARKTMCPCIVGRPTVYPSPLFLHFSQINPRIITTYEMMTDGHETGCLYVCIPVYTYALYVCSIVSTREKGRPHTLPPPPRTKRGATCGCAKFHRCVAVCRGRRDMQIYEISSRDTRIVGKCRDTSRHFKSTSLDTGKYLGKYRDTTRHFSATFLANFPKNYDMTQKKIKVALTRYLRQGQPK